MKRQHISIVCCFLLLAFSLPALAQGKKDEDLGLPPEPPPTPKATDAQLKTTDADIKPTTPVLTVHKKGRPIESRRTWEDIVVIPRKPFIKKGRVELVPFFGATVNDSIIQHMAVGLDVNYHITDVLSLGLTGMYYGHSVSDQAFWARYHYSREFKINKYQYTVALNFYYVPFYGKLSLFNDYILHFEVFASAGVGGTGTEILPRNAENLAFTNPFSLTFPVGLGGRVFVNRWLAVYLGVKDYMMVDKFEPTNRWVEKDGTTPIKIRETDSPSEVDAKLTSELESAKDRADSEFVNSLQFFIGVSFYFPMDFKYTTFR